MAELEEPVLELRSASVRYEDAADWALHDIDLRVRHGELIAVLGAQGSGTSTLCRLAAGRFTATERGAMRTVSEAAAETVTGFRGGAASRSGARAAMLGDDPESQITGLTSFVDDEIQLPARLHGDRAEMAAHAADAAIRELGIERLRGRRLDSLSGGERQLVALAGLLTLRPALLVLDQPALSLDPGARASLLAALQRFRSRGGAVLVTGHQHDELSAAADRIVFIERGRAAPEALRPRDLSGDPSFKARGVWDTRPDDRESALGATSHGASRAERRLRVRELGVTRGRRTVLDRLDLDLDRGEVLAVLGTNGSGKSTLLRALSGLLGTSRNRPRTRVARTGRPLGADDARVSGVISVLDAEGEHALEAFPAHRRAPWLAWVGQDPGLQLSASTVRAELDDAVPRVSPRRGDRASARAGRDAMIAGLLDRFELADRAEAHPYDLRPAERKDLVIATALLLEPSVLLLDEPTLGRDAESMRRLERVVESYAGSGGAVIVTTHDHRWAEGIAHRSLALESGRLRPFPGSPPATGSAAG